MTVGDLVGLLRISFLPSRSELDVMARLVFGGGVGCATVVRKRWCCDIHGL